jgi:hypothetical protein
MQVYRFTISYTVLRKLWICLTEECVCVCVCVGHFAGLGTRTGAGVSPLQRNHHVKQEAGRDTGQLPWS